jgi:hypothetical protein
MNEKYLTNMTQNVLTKLTIHFVCASKIFILFSKFNYLFYLFQASDATTHLNRLDNH